MKTNGIIIRRTSASVKTTIDHFEEFLKNHGATIYARIDQQSEADKVGIALLPLEFLLFGNPAKGIKIIKENVLSSLDLPLKIISWSDGDGQSWVAFNDLAYLTDRFGLVPDTDSPLNLSPMVEYILKNQVPRD